MLLVLLSTYLDSPLESVAECIGSIKEKYASQADFRQLSYRHQIGSVQLELTLGEKVESFTCSPVQAAIIDYCQDKELVKLDDIGMVSINPTTRATFIKLFPEVSNVTSTCSIETYLLTLIRSREEGLWLEHLFCYESIDSHLKFILSKLFIH